MEEGVILQLQDCSVNDGEGIRTVVFFTGCPLRCQWCANPESWTQRVKLAVFRDKCLGCRACAAACPRGLFPQSMDRTLCDACGKCVPVCPGSALKLMCYRASPEEILQKLKRDMGFFRASGGGVTFSGGEPTAQPGLLRALTRGLYDLGVNLCMETCGYFDFESLRDVLEKLDMVFFDLKLMDPALHREYTGADNALILANARRVHALRTPMVVRLPAIQGVNCTKENLTATAEFMRDYLPGARFELLPYHSLGSAKYKALGLEACLHEFETPTKDEIEEAYAVMAAHGVEVVEYR